ncbi:MAG: cupin domain-containing protein [Brachybacterium sp.]|nr:cupin domain-containing protein [Brachybacterium sp.]
MTLPDTDLQHPGSREGAGVLESRLIDISRDVFAEDVWGQRALLTRGASDFSDVFSADAVDELISRRGLRSPFLRVAKDGATLPTSSFTSGAGVGATITDQLDDTALWRHFRDGATLVLQALQRTWEPLAQFSAQLATELGTPVQANAYITPPQNQGFDDHYDVHDVFVLQIEGTKRWVLHPPVLESPLRDQPWTDRREHVAAAAAEEPYIDAVLEPGDALYLPRGWLHAATAQGEVSIHVTLGLHNRTRYAVAEQLTQSVLALLRENPDLRRSVPLGQDEVDETVLRDVREAITEVLGNADPSAAWDRGRRAEMRPAPLGPLAQLRALGANDDPPLVLREHLDARLQGERLWTRVGWLDFSDAELEQVRVLLEGRTVTAAQIGKDLAERLLRVGVLVPVAS